MSRGRGVEGGSVARFLLTMLIVVGIALCNVVTSPVGPLRGNLAVAAPPSVDTLPASGISTATATLNGEITASGEPYFTAVSAGYNHSLGVRSDGTLWAWGYNAYGQLGLGDTTDRWSPTQVGSAANWVAVSAGYRHSLGVRSDGTLWAWGRNTHITAKTDANPEITSHGQLGLGDTTDRWSPSPVGSGTDWVTVAAGGGHSLGVRSDGTLWAWGRNYFGQLGLDDRGDGTDRWIPSQVGSAANWVVVSAGYEHSLGVRSDGTLWAWGWNPHHELGLGDTPQAGEYSPTRVGSATNWVGASAVFYYSLGVRSDGTLWGWGMNNYAQLGLGYAGGGDVIIPTQAGSASNWVAASGGIQRSVGLRSDGTLWNWGGVFPYQALSPKQVGSATDWGAVDAGGAHFLGLRSGGTLWAWGANGSGELGLGDTNNRGSPTEVVFSTTSSWQVSFEWGLTSSYGNETAPQTMTGVGVFSADVGGLTLGATYHFRAKTVAGDGTGYGGDMTFTTTEAPSVTTNDAGSITANSASLSGELTWLGTAGSVTVSFEWGTSPGAYSRETTGQAMTSTGAFTTSISGLTPATTYHFRAKAVGNGISYSAESSFTALGEAPSIEAVTADGGRRGNDLTVTISGSGLSGVTGIDFGPGITIRGVRVVSDGEITVEITIDSDAELGARDVSVTTPMGTDTMTGGFAVTARSSGLQWWMYPMAIVGGLMALMILVAVGARVVRRLAG